MTVTEMHTAIGLMMDDPDEDRWGEDIKNQALNAAQAKIVKSLPSDLMPELQESVVIANISAAGEPLAAALAATGAMLPGRFVACYVDHVNVEQWAGFIFIDDAEFRTQNYYLKGSDESPIAYIFDDTLFVLVSAATYDVDVTFYYMRTPKKMTKTGAGAYETDTCELAESRHDMVVEAACGRIMLWDGELSDGNTYNQRVGQELGAELQILELEKRRLNRR